MQRSRLVSSALLAGGALALVAAAPVAASAAPVAKPSPSCKVPVFSVSPLKASPGSKVTVSGVNFSGCKAQGSSATPTPVLTVKVGVETASKMGALLATTKTTATGTFSVQVTVPPLSSGGVAKLELAAAATDAATGLTYTGVAVLAYDVASPTPSASPTSGGGIPTAVPAGSGGRAASTSTSSRQEQVALGGVGVLMIAAGGTAVTRRRIGRHH